MENNNTPAISQELAVKKEAWGNIGLSVVSTNILLKEKRDAALLRISNLPKDASQIVAYEGILAQAKKEQKEIQEDRKAVTSKFDAVITGLMEPEKSMDGPIKAYADALLSVKQEKAKADSAVQAKSSEVSRVREQLANSINAQVASFETKIVDKVSKCFEYCLNNNILAQDMPATMDKMIAALTDKDFTLQSPQVTLSYLTVEEMVNIWAELSSNHKPDAFVIRYLSALKERFEHYEIDFKNKEAALELEKQNKAAALAEIETKRQDEEVASKLTALADVAVVSEDAGKAIKSVYVLDMEENQQNAIIILAGFAANWAKCKEKLRIKKWFNLSIAQMGEALVAMKNEDNNFSITGIVFKKVDKL